MELRDAGGKLRATRQLYGEGHTTYERQLRAFADEVWRSRAGAAQAGAGAGAGASARAGAGASSSEAAAAAAAAANAQRGEVCHTRVSTSVANLEWVDALYADSKLMPRRGKPVDETPKPMAPSPSSSCSENNE